MIILLNVFSSDKSPDILLDGKKADKSSHKLNKHKSLHVESPIQANSSEEAKGFPDIKMHPETFNGQYVKIDPLKYNAQSVQLPPAYKLDAGRPAYITSKIEEEYGREMEARNVYDKVYEDMLKYRTPHTSVSICIFGTTDQSFDFFVVFF